MNDHVTTPPIPSVVSDTISATTQPSEPLSHAAQAKLLAAVYRKLRAGHKRPLTKGAFGRSHFWDKVKDVVKTDGVPVTPPTETIAPSP